MTRLRHHTSPAAQAGYIQISARNALAIVILSIVAAGSWYLASTLEDSAQPVDGREVAKRGFYLRDARILGTGGDGALVYEIEADYAEQGNNDEIAFERVNVRYSPASDVPWVLSADNAVISGNLQKLTLSGHVLAVSERGFSGKTTEIRTEWLELEPENFVAYTDRRVQIRIGERSLTATGMEASLQENRLELKSNVSGKFVP